MTEEEKKAKKAAYMKKYNEEHKEQIREWTKKYREEHKEEIRAQKREYTAKNKEKKREWDRNDYERHKEKRIAKAKEYQEQHKEQAREWKRKYKRKIAEINRGKKAACVHLVRKFTGDRIKHLSVVMADNYKRGNKRMSRSYNRSNWTTEKPTDATITREDIEHAYEEMMKNKKQAQTENVVLTIDLTKMKKEETKRTYCSGRPDKSEIVRMWQEEHPEGRKIDCARETGLSQTTVLRWWT